MTKQLDLNLLIELFEKSDAVLFRWNNDSSWSIDCVSLNVLALLGYSQDEFYSNNISYSSCILEEDLVKVTKEVTAAIDSNSNFFKHKPYRIKTKNNEIKWVLDYTVLQKNNNNQITHFLGYILDITEQIQKDILLQESEYRWKFAIEGSFDGLWDWNVKTSEVFFSKQWKKMLGFEEDEIESSLKEWEKRVHPDDIKGVYTDIQKYFDGITDIYESTHRVLCKDGNYKWILDRGSIVSRDEEGNPTRFIGTHRDISNVKAQEEKISELNAQYSVAQQVGKLGIVFDFLGEKPDFWNQGFYDIFEIDYKSAPSKELAFSKILTEDRKIIQSCIQNVLETHIKGLCEVRIAGKEKLKYLECNIAYEQTNGYKPYLIVTLTDVTNIKEQERQIKEQAELLSNFVIYSKTDKDGIITDVSHAFCEISGYTREELIGESHNLIRHYEMSREFLKRCGK